MSYKPGDTFYYEFVTSSPTTGAAVNADSLPAAVLARNGVDDGTVTVAVANVGTGRYRASGAIPSGYAGGDSCQVIALATVATVAGAGVVGSFVLDGNRVSDVYALMAGLQIQGKVTASPAPSTTGFGGVTPTGGALPATTGYFVNTNLPMQVCFTSGQNLGVKVRITGYTSAGVFTTDPLPFAPAANDTFDVI